MSKIKFVLNNKKVTFEGDLSRRLLDVLREDYELVGPKEGCGEGECGACAILFNGNIVNSCLLPMSNVANNEIMTIEGFSQTKRYEVLEDAFEKHGAVQCGYCTPGMIIASESLLNKNPTPSVDEIKDGLSGNLCRCTGYNMIIDAILEASKREDGLW